MKIQYALFEGVIRESIEISVGKRDRNSKYHETVRLAPGGLSVMFFGLL